MREAAMLLWRMCFARQTFVFGRVLSFVFRRIDARTEAMSVAGF
jgi:hypothetical protein